MEGSILRVLVLVVTVIVVVNFGALPMRAELSPEACKAERHVGINVCKPVLYGYLPSPQCCQQVVSAHIECVCPIITPKLAALQVWQHHYSLNPEG